MIAQPSLLIRPERKRGRAMRATLLTHRIAAIAAIATALTLGAASAASAADTPKDDSTSDVTVSVPAATPTGSPSPTPSPTPSQTPWTPPPAGDAPAGGGSTGRAGGSGGAGGATNTPPAGPATEPRIAPAPSTTGEKATADKEHYVFGDSVTVRMDGFTAGEQVQIVLYSEPQLIGNVAAGADGVLSHTFALPKDLPAGTHTVQLTGWQSQRVGTVEIFVTGPAAASTSADAQGVPPWVWWAGGGLGLVLLIVGGWWVIGTMRAPVAEATA